MPNSHENTKLVRLSLPFYERMKERAERDRRPINTTIEMLVEKGEAAEGSHPQVAG